MDKLEQPIEEGIKTEPLTKFRELFDREIMNLVSEETSDETQKLIDKIQSELEKREKSIKKFKELFKENNEEEIIQKYVGLFVANPLLDEEQDWSIPNPTIGKYNSDLGNGNLDFLKKINMDEAEELAEELESLIKNKEIDINTIEEKKELLAKLKELIDEGKMELISDSLYDEIYYLFTQKGDQLSINEEAFKSLTIKETRKAISQIEANLKQREKSIQKFKKAFAANSEIFVNITIIGGSINKFTNFPDNLIGKYNSSLVKGDLTFLESIDTDEAEELIEELMPIIEKGKFIQKFTKLFKENNQDNIIQTRLILFANFDFDEDPDDEYYHNDSLIIEYRNNLIEGDLDFLKKINLDEAEQIVKELETLIKGIDIKEIEEKKEILTNLKKFIDEGKMKLISESLFDEIDYLFDEEDDQLSLNEDEFSNLDIDAARDIVKRIESDLK
jgi:hypothetical protein